MDIEAGIQRNSTTQRIAICNNEVLNRYYKHFIRKQEQKRNNSDLIEKVGCYIEELIEQEE